MSDRPSVDIPNPTPMKDALTKPFRPTTPERSTTWWRKLLELFKMGKKPLTPEVAFQKNQALLDVQQQAMDDVKKATEVFGKVKEEATPA